MNSKKKKKTFRSGNPELDMVMKGDQWTARV